MRIRPRKSMVKCAFDRMGEGSVSTPGPLHQDRRHHPRNQVRHHPAPGHPRPQAPHMTSTNDFAGHPGFLCPSSRYPLGISRKRWNSRPCRLPPGTGIPGIRGASGQHAPCRPWPGTRDEGSKHTPHPEAGSRSRRRPCHGPRGPAVSPAPDDAPPRPSFSRTLSARAAPVTAM
jgi:hypothetical protein